MKKSTCSYYVNEDYDYQDIHDNDEDVNDGYGGDGDHQYDDRGKYDDNDDNDDN